MPPKFRLTRADFKLFSSQKAHRVRGAYFTLAIIPLTPGTPSKATCIVSKKTAKKATDRNLIKRRVRAILQLIVPHIKNPTAIAFYANPASSKAIFEQLSQDILTLLQKERLL